MRQACRAQSERLPAKRRSWRADDNPCDPLIHVVPRCSVRMVVRRRCGRRWPCYRAVGLIRGSLKWERNSLCIVPTCARTYIYAHKSPYVCMYILSYVTCKHTYSRCLTHSTSSEMAAVLLRLYIDASYYYERCVSQLISSLSYSRRTCDSQESTNHDGWSTNYDVPSPD